MNKKIALLLSCILCFTIALSGCNLFTLDSLPYLNQTVATIEYPASDGGTKTLKIIKKDLIQSYNNYKSTLEQSGYTGEQAYDQLIQLLVNKEVTLEEARRLIEIDEIKITNKDLNKLWDDTFKAMIKNLAEIENEVIESWKLHVPSELAEETEDETTYYKPFEKQAEIVKIMGETEDDVEWKIRTFSDVENEDDEELSYIGGKEIDTIYSAVNSRIGDSNILKEAFKRYVKMLKLNEAGQNLSEDSESVFKREIERIYNNIKHNLYLNLYSEYFEIKNGYSIISVEQVLSYLSANMLSNYAQYSIDFAAYENDILSARENSWYVMDDNYFYVSHILVSFSDEQKEVIKSWKTNYESGQISYKDYEQAKKNIANNAVVQDYGKDTTWNPETLRNNLLFDLDGKTDERKAEIFNDYMYKYSGDGGNKNVNYEYIVGTENSKMVEEYTDAARELYNNGQGKFGDVSETVVTEYGVHILFYVAPVTNPFTIHNPNTFNLVSTNLQELENNINTITTFKLSPFYERTLFDFVYEKMVTDNFSKFENLNLSILKKDLDIKIYNKNYSDLWNF
ncbi:MAG: hypothetical protein PHH71_03455 [Clostridia bacterium]|nr:hypothetical protein [Clostridia bacterium]